MKLAPALLLLLCLLPRSAYAWGCRGHQIVAALAWAHLSPEIAVEANRILVASPVARNPNCRAAGMPLFVQVSTWADSVRTPSTAPLHYVDIPLRARRPGFDYARLCHDDCVTSSIAHFSQQLRVASNPAARAEALRYLIHLVGDVYQPLHAANDADEGGSCVAVRLPNSQRKTTLHAAWDAGLLSHMRPAASPAAFAVRLDQEFDSRFVHGSSDPVDWAWQSHAAAVQYVYAPLHLSPGCRRQPLPLDRAYVRQATSVIEQQLDRAGQSLTQLLTSLLAPRITDHRPQTTSPPRITL